MGVIWPVLWWRQDHSLPGYFLDPAGPGQRHGCSGISRHLGHTAGPWIPPHPSGPGLITSHAHPHRGFVQLRVIGLIAARAYSHRGFHLAVRHIPQSPINCRPAARIGKASLGLWNCASKSTRLLLLWIFLASGLLCCCSGALVVLRIVAAPHELSCPENKESSLRC